MKLYHIGLLDMASMHIENSPLDKLNFSPKNSRNVHVFINQFYGYAKNVFWLSVVSKGFVAAPAPHGSSKACATGYELSPLPDLNCRTQGLYRVAAQLEKNKMIIVHLYPGNHPNNKVSWNVLHYKNLFSKTNCIKQVKSARTV